MSQRKHIFTAGPAVLPVEVLSKLSESVLDYEGMGQSIIELSHRSKTFEAVQDRAEQGIRRLLGLKDDDQVLFLQGGASTQFSMVPMNLRASGSADYLITGTWSKKALAEAKRLGSARVAASTEDQKFASVPENWELDDKAAYVHYTSNNTIFGTQWSKTPKLEGKVVCDMSSDIFSRPIDMADYSLIYAGAQKNAGPSGVTLVIIGGDLYKELEAADDKTLPTMLNYCTHVPKQSRFNTPPTFSIYALTLVVEWLEARGGLSAMAEVNGRKAAMLYELIDSNDCYQGVADKGSRSLMNVCFRLADESRQADFLSLAEKAGMVGLKGHRSVGGLRASLYNAVPEASVAALCDFMKEFASKSS